MDNDPSSASFHDVYVADTAGNKISKFTPEGKLEESWGSEGQLDGSTTSIGTWSTGDPGGIGQEIAGIAVGPDGTFYVMNNEVPTRVFEFKSKSTFKSEVMLEKFVAADGLAVDAAGDLFKVTLLHKIAEFAPGGGLLHTITPEGVSGQTALGPEGDVYSAGLGGTLDRYEFNGGGEVVEPGAGTCAEECPPTDTTTVGFAGSGIGVNADGDPLLSNGAGSEVWELGSSVVTVPDATTGAASVHSNSVTLNGTVNPEELQLKACEFEYVEASKYDANALNPYAGGGTVACEAPSAAEIGLVNEEVSVHTTVTGLQHGTTYDFRLIAANENDESSPLPAAGVDKEFETFPPPAIDSATVSDLTASSATLNASINPDGLQTEWYFEYDERPYLPGEAEHGTRTAVQQIAPGAAAVAVSSTVKDLEPGVHYFWRVVASNEAGVTLGTGHVFVYSAGPSGLPDGRAYEMVSPNRKDGALLGDVAVGGVPDVAAGGDGVVAMAIQCFAGAQSCNSKNDDAVGSPYEFSRTDDAGQCAPVAAPCWRTIALAPSAVEFPGVAPASFGYSAQDGASLFSIPTGPALGGNGENDFYRREADGRFVRMGPDTPPEAGAQGPSGGLVTGAGQAQTADFSHFAWDATYLWSAPLSLGTDEVFEYAGAGGAGPLQVGVVGGEGSSELVSGCGTTLGPSSQTVGAPGEMSADGRTVFFSTYNQCASGAYGPVPVDGEVYARVDGESAGARTVAISEPEASSPAAPGAYKGYEGCTSAKCIENTENPMSPATNPNWRGAEFVGASEDGSRAFFTSTQQLTDGAGEDSTSEDNAATKGCAATVGVNGCNLYEFEGGAAGSAGERRLVDVSEGEGGAPVPGGPRVQGVVAVSPGAAGEPVYFVAKGRLTDRERPGCMAEWEAVERASEADCHAVDGLDNLYVYSQESHSVSFVTVMSAKDESEWKGAPGNPANVTPDGGFLVFVSRVQLTADDTDRSGANQVFRYDAGTGGLVRVSAGDDGFNDDGNRSAASPCNFSDSLCAEDANIAKGIGASRSDPSMSDDGSRVFFESPIGLTPHALDDVTVGNSEQFLGEGNFAVYAQNVYEWEAAGVGSCSPARSAGCVFLISDGRDVGATRGASVGCGHGSDVCLLGSDASGSNVFFVTTDQLSSSDTNSELDYYDARVCEPEHGNPCVQAPSEPPPGCSGEECHGVPAGVPGVASGPTLNLNGPGNVALPTGKPSPKVETRAQKLTRALATCRHKYKKKTRRKACEVLAHKKYGVAKKSRNSKKKGKS